MYLFQTFINMTQNVIIFLRLQPESARRLALHSSLLTPVHTRETTRTGWQHQAKTFLYMAALAGVIRNPGIAAFYECQLKAGKIGKVALVAYMRILLIIQCHDKKKDCLAAGNGL